MSRVILKNISYKVPNGTKIFENLSFSFNSELIGLVGKNGSGKSTLAKLISNRIECDSGRIEIEGNIEYMPQLNQDLSDKSISEVFKVSEKYEALIRLETGRGNEQDLIIIDNDWDLENRINLVKKELMISHIDLNRKFSSLSGGEKIKCKLASLLLANPQFIILDEPTNHLDLEGRKIVYDFVSNWKGGMIVISHDRTLLRLMNSIAELNSSGLKLYGGNYDFYKEQKELEDEAVNSELRNINSEYKKAVLQKDEVLQRQLKNNISGEKRALKANMPKIMLNQMKGSGEKTFQKLKNSHSEKINSILEKRDEVKSRKTPRLNIKIDFDNSNRIKKNTLITAERINFSFNEKNNIWQNDISFNIKGGERILLKGKNGSGKTTLINLILGKLKPESGNLLVRTDKIGILDQEVSILKNELSVLDNLKNVSEGKIEEHELRIRLGRFLFYKDDVFKKAEVLSGGERMRAGIACLLCSSNSPELLILDEPTNNLDLESINELACSIKEFKGSVLVVSHDIDFLNEIGIDNEIDLNNFC